MTASPTPTPSSVPANSSFPTTAPITTAAPKPTSTLTFAVGADQARYVATVVAFVDAFNAGAVDAALALLADNVVGSDCDYGRQTLITFQSKRDAEPWLRGRAAEHDRIEIAEIVNERRWPSGMVLFPIGSSVGGPFTSLTVIVMSSESVAAPSVTWKCTFG